MIYLDNSATTALSNGARIKMIEAMDCFGNPSSLHSVGYSAGLMLEEARRAVENSLGLRQGSGYRIVFTGSGTEANNLAITGSATAKSRFPSKKIITTDSEHPSVAEPIKNLENAGFEVIRLSTRAGVLDSAEYRAALEGGAFLVSVMMVNNETGAAYDVASMFALARRLCPGVITHCDATQGYLKLPINPRRLGADLVTISAHKIHGPKGVGALCISPEIIKAKKIVPILRGGGQEGGFRSGTENMIGIAGFGGAVSEYYPNFEENTKKIAVLRDYTEERLKKLEGIRLNRPAGDRAPHIINFTLPDIKSETMVHFLASRGISVSSGSACASRGEHVSASLLGFGLSKREAGCSIRVSLCDTNTESEIDAFIEALTEGLGSLVRIG